ncbi:SprT family zinc-dependent metalloprotease [Aliiglaciecola sp. CAU 1673]|uniref:SprT family zinc-dependent metalloprotease n=1 Tax=Aliiglaciecola sp. CAU 1673 TaxID=3032595 RepID=UPI0023DA669C|nr:SprT family zinc-dependent metalloprotease [Aliiglaciecola sp. CAU 1673]MDF2180227.1 SprT family zinc-dependent metalloprotease [Aliiglaciecola sp. CAU 1673]
MQNHSSISPDIIQQVHARLDECLQAAGHYLDRTIAKPTLSFNQRGKIAGSARLQRHEIRLNPVLMADNLACFLNDVIPHELCHLLVFQLYGRGSRFRPILPHGPEWKALMQGIFNLPGKATHQMDVSKVQGRQFVYRCGCGPVSLSVRRHNKVLKGTRYICRSCRESLVAA